MLRIQDPIAMASMVIPQLTHLAVSSIMALWSTSRSGSSRYRNCLRKHNPKRTIITVHKRVV